MQEEDGRDEAVGADEDLEVVPAPPVELFLEELSVVVSVDLEGLHVDLELYFFHGS